MFRIYAALAILGGAIVVLWGPPWLGTAAVTRVFSAMLVASGCWAATVSLVEDPVAYFRTFYWFVSGHEIIVLVVFLERTVLWGPGRHPAIEQILWVAFFVPMSLMVSGGRLLQGRITRREILKAATVPGGGQARIESILRSHYERQIRQAGAQEERNRLARDLHDSVKQQIFVIQTAAATAQARFNNDREGASTALDQIRNSARDAMTEMEAMMDQLRSAPLENAGLVDALKKQCEALGHRTGAKVEFTLGDIPANETLPPGSHQAFLRVAQEALANVGRHARASNVTVSLGSNSGLLELRIKDDGAGFDKFQGRRGMGIENMRERAKEFGGEFDLTSSPGIGTVVAFSVPPDEALRPAGYRKWAYIYGVGLVVFVVFLARGVTNSIPMIVWCAVEFVRNARDWRRAQSYVRVNA